MSETLSSFLIDLASDPGQMARFLADPAGALDGSGLTAEERAALMARDSAQLRRALGAPGVQTQGVAEAVAIARGVAITKKKKGATKKKPAKKKPAKKKK